MKFTCPKCQTRHHLADEEISDGNTRIACPSCGHALTLKRRPPGETQGAAGTSAAQAPVAAASPALLPAPAQTSTPFDEGGLNSDEQEEPFPALGDTVDLDDPFAKPTAGSPNQPDSKLGTALLGTPINTPPPPKDAAYFEAPPGADTQMFMNVAGIYRQRRNRRIGAIVSLVLVTLIAGIVIGDAKGLVSLPWLGSLYAMSGIKDPNAGRGRARVEAMLQQDTLSPAEREALRKKLMGGGDAAAAADPVKPRPTKTFSNAPTPSAAAPAAGAATPLAAAPSAAMERFDADGKKEHVIGGDSDDKPAPGGLSQEQIYKVISDNNRSMGLCYGEAARKGEKLRGKMEVQITIDANGQVSDVSIETSKFRGTAMADCTARRVKNWKFPKFTGEPVSVVFPYMLSSSL